MSCIVSAMADNSDLLKFVTSVAGDAHLKVEENLGDGFVRLKLSEAERRQAKHDIRSIEDIVVELLRNARDAHARRVFVATSREGEERLITLLDDGVGVPVAMHDHIFEPRVTSKLDTMVMDRWGVHGRGMALFSIRSNVAEARIAASGQHRGSSFHIRAHVPDLPERADQSTWPAVERDENGMYHVSRGPHNIVRRTVEFALEHPEMDVFIGSVTEILATLVLLARFEMDESELLFCEDLARLPVWQRPGAASDAIELASTAEQVGLPVSERTAHRILAGEIVGLTNVRAMLTTSAPANAEPTAADIYRDRRGLKIDPADLDALRLELEHAFDTIAERYYLHLRCAPRITVGRDDIRVKFEVDKED